MPLCMRDHIVTPNITRISSSRLNIVHVQVPSCQVVGKHVQFWGESGSSLIDRRQQVYSSKIYSLLPKESIEKFDHRTKGVF